MPQHSIEIFRDYSGKDDKQKKLIGIVEIMPSDQQKINLGVYNEDRPPLGYLIIFEPEGIVDEEVTTQINTVAAGQNSLFQLNMFLANYGPSTVTARIYELLEKP